MTTHHDRSHKDKKYFIDGNTYNCPFCERRQIKYKVTDYGSYDSSNTTKVYFYVVRCEDCRKTSFHLSKYELKMHDWGSYREKSFPFPLKYLTTNLSGKSSQEIENELLNEDGTPKELDHAFFFNQPSSFFIIDERIPNVIREPLSESETSLKSNLLTGASGALRKAIYKLLQTESIPEANNQGVFISHDQRVDYLKGKYPKIDTELFDELKAVHMLTSQELHENDWEDFDGPTLRFLIGVINEILTEIYITPDETKKRREEIAALKKKAKPKKGS
jgi:hypothetical protein